jgi:hypothetical protein
MFLQLLLSQLLQVGLTVAQVPSAVDIPAFAVHPAVANVPATVVVPAFPVGLTVSQVLAAVGVYVFCFLPCCC